MFCRRSNVIFVNLALAVAACGLFGCRPSQAQVEKSEEHHDDMPPMPKSVHDHTDQQSTVDSARVSPPARKNLGLVSKPLQLTSFWIRIEVPGVITDRPGISDRGVAAPVTGIVTKIHANPGDTIAPESPLFSLRIVSDTIHTSQLELFKATKEIEIARQQKKRLEEVAQSGALAQSRIIELDNQILRMGVNVLAFRQDLLVHGLPPETVDAAAKGEFVTQITVKAPAAQNSDSNSSSTEESTAADSLPFSFELQSLKVELGQQIEAGEVLCYLADHRALFIEGRAFKKELPQIQQAARNGLPVDLAFEMEEGSQWPPMPKQLEIRHIANVIDTESRSFAFYLALENQWQVYEQDGHQRWLWRFRPGDRVRLFVAVEKLENVFVLPRSAVVWEGPEAYIFRQDGDYFDRLPVHVLYEDNDTVAFASDIKIRPGFFVAQNAAAQLNRVLKSQVGSGMSSNAHVHADGTVHSH
jgi:cobalt-zinc-cadmium efflux system membrane fusion protein